MLTNINLVAAGIGVSVVPASMRGFRTDSVTYCRLGDAGGLRAPITLAYQRDSRKPAAANFIALARRHAGALKAGRAKCRTFPRRAGPRHSVRISR